jgi:hypothetical protein
MPKPPTAQPATPTATGTAGNRAAASQAMAVATIRNPVRISRRPGQSAALRSWTQAPAVQDRVAAVTATLATTVLCPLAEVMARGT